MSSLCIVDYGVGNVHSVLKACKQYTDDVIVSENPSDVDSASAIILPGQGAFATSMRGIESRNLLGPLQQAAQKGIPILGICIGAQILLTTGYEFGEHAGLGLIPGSVRAFPELTPGSKVPHMGWNEIAVPEGISWNGTLLESVPDGSDMYFIHSYVMQPEDEGHVLAYATHGEHTFAAVVRRDNIVGCQFHPEKSGRLGLSIIEKFVRMIA